MNKIYLMWKRFSKDLKDNDIYSMADALAFRIIFGTVPFLIFFMSLLGFLNLKIPVYSSYIFKNTVPVDALEIMREILKDVLETKSISLLSTSLIVVIYSASSIFNAFIIGINKAFGTEDRLSFLKRRLLSVFLIILFAIILVLCLILIIFGDAIKSLLFSHNIRGIIFDELFGLTGNLITIAIILFILTIFYKIALPNHIKIRYLLPGSCTCVSLWYLFSVLFNIYVNNFAKYSTIYGSIAGVFVFLIWLYFICFFLLLGGQINATFFKENAQGGNKR